MADWHDLERELDAWRAAGRSATLWWRDDDAVRATPALERLLALAEGSGVPLALAVIPAGAEQSLAHRLEALPSVAVLQHGYAHRNHAPPEERKCELGPHRPLGAVVEELMRGRQRMRALFPDQELPVLVPPWNRIDAALVPSLTRAGFSALSTLGPCRSRRRGPGLSQVNVHVDACARPDDPSAALNQALGHLARRRSGEGYAEEPTGLMTHHLVHDDACWEFLGEFVRRTAAHPAVRWLAAPELFPN